MSVDVFLDRLEKVKKNGSGWMALCPCHDDHDPSLSIDAGRNGGVVMYCHACQAKGDAIAQALGVDKAELAASGTADPKGVGRFELADADRRHRYNDEAGMLLYNVGMFRRPGGSKTFRPFLPSGRQGYGDRRVLYRLDELVKSAGSVVYLVEGEKDADSLVSLGLIATTNPMGAGKFGRCDTSALDDRDVIVIGDNDDAGRSHVADVATRLQGRASSVRVVGLPGIPPKGDVSDWLNDGHTLEELEGLINSPLDSEPVVPTDSSAQVIRHTDVGNSTRLIELHGDHLRYVIEWGTWIVWDGTFWVVDRNKVAVFELAKDVSSDLYRQAADNPGAAEKLSGWAKQSATRGRIESMTHLARGIDGVVISHDELDTDPWLLGVANGYIDLRTGSFHEPDPSKLMTMQASVSYDPNAKAPRWMQALEEWFPDAEVRRYIQSLSGHALSGASLGDHIFAIHYGDGRNGKGTYMRAHKHVLGPYYVTPDKSLLVQRRHEQHATVKARLFRTRLAVASETEQRERLNEAQVKNLTGGDPINARRMREDEWEFEPTHSLWLQTNYPPEIHGIDTGIWSRIRIVPWTVTFNGHTDDDLDATLANEAAGILNWMIEGCIEWQRHGLDEPEAVVRATLDYRTTEDVLARFAADVGLEFGKGHTVVDADLKARLGGWAIEEGVDRPDAKKVNNWMKANGCREGRENYTKDDGKISKRKVWKGARFVQSVEDVEELSENAGAVEESALTGRSGPMFPVKRPREPHIETNRQGRSSTSRLADSSFVPAVLDGPHGHGEGTEVSGAGTPATKPGERPGLSVKRTEPGPSSILLPEIPACPECGNIPKAILPSGLCRPCSEADGEIPP